MSEYIIGISAEVIERAKNGEKILVTPKLTEVVRCRDCKHYEQRAEVRKQTFTVSSEPWCNKLVKCVEPDGFCAWGVRKDD